MKKILTLRSANVAMMLISSALIFTPAQSRADAVNTDTVLENATPYEMRLSESQILSRIHRINKIEILAARIALGRAYLPETRQYAFDLLEEHEAADRELVQLARNEGIELGLGVPVTVREVAELTKSKIMLSRLSVSFGRGFDKMYLQYMKESHAESLWNIEDYVSVSRNPDVREFLARTYSDLRAHMQSVETIQRML